MPALTARNVRKSFGTHVVLDDATMTLVRGEKVGLIGANGAGKSTLARVLAGIEVPDAGSVSTRRGLTVQYLAQEPALDPAASARAVVEGALTAWRAATTLHAQRSAELAEASGAADAAAVVAEQAELAETIERLGGWERGHEALGFLDRLGVRDVDRPCGSRSGGERRRIALAQLLVASPDVAILDEPTNHLDADTAAWLEEYLSREFRGAIVLVTHDRYFLDAVAGRIVELERGRLTSYPGGYGDYLEKKAELLAHEERVEQNRQNALRREREWLARGPKARGTKQKARIQRAMALEEQAPATAGRPGAVSLLTAAAPQQGKTVVELHGVAFAVAPATPPLTLPIDLFLTAGERMGVVGPNGAGKTTLLRALVAAVDEARGREPSPEAPRRVAGRLVVGKNTRVAYLDQARADLDPEKSIFDEVRGEGGATLVHMGSAGATLDLRSFLELFLFDAQKQRQPVGALSGGERARVTLAKTLRAGANLLLLDEPTNDLDLPTLAALEEMLLGYEGSVVVVTHDRAFLDRVATGILAFEPDPAGAGPSRVTRYGGGYEDYVAQREAGRMRAGAGAEVGPGAGAGTGTGAGPSAGAGPGAGASAGGGPAKKGKGGLTYAERLELEGIVEAIEKAEGGVAEVEALLADPELYAKRGHEVAAVQARLEAARARVAALVARWEALEEKKGAAAGPPG